MAAAVEDASAMAVVAEEVSVALKDKTVKAAVKDVAKRDAPLAAVAKGVLSIVTLINAAPVELVVAASTEAAPLHLGPREVIAPKENALNTTENIQDKSKDSVLLESQKKQKLNHLVHLDLKV